MIDIAREYGDVFVAAPSTHQSGKSSALTVDVPLRARLFGEEPGLTAYHVGGTPTDCIKLAVSNLMPRRPDIVLSGINHGYNSGNSAIYSGTMGVVFEGSFLGVPSIGFSYGDYSAAPDFSVCEPVVRHMVELAVAGYLPTGVCYNVNIPKCDRVAGLKTVAAAPGRINITGLQGNMCRRNPIATSTIFTGCNAVMPLWCHVVPTKPPVMQYHKWTV